MQARWDIRSCTQSGLFGVSFYLNLHFLHIKSKHEGNVRIYLQECSAKLQQRHK